MTFKFVVFSSCMKPANVARNELRMILSDCLQKRRRSCAVYTVPLYTVLICSTSEGSLSIVDTHAVSDQLKGDCTNGVIVQCLNTVTALAAVTNWLFARLFRSVVEVQHELAIIIPQHTIVDDQNATSSVIEQPLNASCGMSSVQKHTQAEEEVIDKTPAVSLSSVSQTETLYCSH